MQDYSSTTISLLVLLPLLVVFAVAGNVLVLGIIARIKKFRTFPNILIANLAFMDLLRALIEAPMYRALGCPECRMVYRKDFCDYFAFCDPPLFSS